MIKLLMTSVGSLVGQNLLDVIDDRPDDFRVVGMTSVATIPLQRCARVYLVPATKRPPSAFSQQLLEIIDTEQPDLVIPTRDCDVTALAHLAAERRGLTERIPCGSPATALLLEDKWLSFCFAREHDLPFAESAISDAASGHRAVWQLVEDVGFPLVAKPRAGFGSRRVLLLSSAEQLEAALAEEGLVLQRYIGSADTLETLHHDIARRGLPLFYSLEQDKFSLQVYIQQDGAIGPVCTTLHRMEAGYSVAVERLWDDGLVALGGRWARALAEAGWRGPLNVQCQQDPGGVFVAFELNGRFTGATAARYCLGHDELGYLVQDRLGPARVQNRTVVDRVPIKYYRTLGVSQADVEVLSRCHVWERPEPSRQTIKTIRAQQGDVKWARYPSV
jgi:hypothetical protein